MKTFTLLTSKSVLTFAFVSAMVFCSAQDTLNCEKDLAYDSKGKFYYRKGDDAKVPVSGNAICHPKKGMVNRGKLVDGKWHGLVTGYEGSRMVGKANYKQGIYDGLKVCYAENGRTKDSTIYQEGIPKYSYTAKYDKSGNRKQIVESNYDDGTKVYYYYEVENGMEYVSQINRFKGKKKDGYQEYMKASSEASGSIFTYTYEEQNYSNGELKTITYYDKGIKYKVNDYSDGKLSMQNDIADDGSVAASYPLKRGKKHGTATIYETGAGKPRSAEYRNGKLVTQK